MGYGRNADRVAGALSRLLHLRGAKQNTIGYLHRYLDLPRAELFPAPSEIRDLRMRRTLLDRVRRTSTLSWTSTHEVLCPRYRERHHGEYAANLTAWARWIRPAGAPHRDCLVYVHGWLEPGSWAEEATLFRRWVKDLDVDIVHVALPFHGPRKPKEALFSGEFFWTADLVRSMEGVRQAVCDVRGMVSWLRKQGYTRIGITGISLGGAITMLLACLEPLPDFIIPIIAHLELEAAVEEAPILWRMKQDLENWGVDAQQRRDLFKRLGLSSYKPVLAPDRQLWIQAREDVYIDAVLAEAQWRAWGEPNILWIDGGHMTFGLHLDPITERMGVFLDHMPVSSRRCGDRVCGGAAPTGNGGPSALGLTPVSNWHGACCRSLRSIRLEHDRAVHRIRLRRSSVVSGARPDGVRIDRDGQGTLGGEAA